MPDQTYIDTAHLLRRAGFGADPATIKQAAAAGLDATTESLLHPETVPEDLNDTKTLASLSSILPETKNDGTPTQAVKMWWVHRMIASPRPLVEKMTLFWHGHFTSRDGGMQGDLLYQQNQLFRTHALGSFRTLTLAVSRNPEMLRYLNGNENHKAHANENYGRELMELYTCGIGPIDRPNYTEEDVKAAARAFSGWNLRGGEFRFNPNQHDNDPKTFMGKTGNWNGDDIVDILVAHPATAKRLCTQLFTYFAYPDPEPQVLDALVQTYYASGYDVGAVMGRILKSKAFYSEKARFAVIKSPAQYVVGTVKMLGLDKAVELAISDITQANEMAYMPTSTTMPAAPAATVPAAPTAPAVTPQQAAGRKLAILAGLPGAMRSMGQDLLAPPTVKGWDGGEAWINTSTLLARINFANAISNSRQWFGGQVQTVTSYLQQNSLTPEAWVDLLIDSLGPLPLTAGTRQTLVDFVNSSDALAPSAQPPTIQNAQFVPPAPGPFRRGRRNLGGGYNRLRNAAPGGLEGRLRAVLPMIMATPEYQVC
ncbi:MAG: DUF1800 domain-containing protein [Janthinobacterium lividum]